MIDHVVTLRDGTIHTVHGADAYQSEGPMTTFFTASGSRRAIDSWSVRVASVRTDQILLIHRSEATPAA